MLSEVHLKQLREAFPTMEWEASGPHPNSWTGRFGGGMVVHLTCRPTSREVYVDVTVLDGAKPYVSKWSEHPDTDLDELVTEVIGAAVACLVVEGETPAPKSKLDFPLKLGLDFAMLVNRLDPRIQQVADKILISRKKSAKADIAEITAEMKRRIKAHDSMVARTEEALTILRRGELSLHPPEANLLHRNLRHDLPAEWCSWSRLGIRAELVPGLTVDVGQAIITPIHREVGCEVRVGERRCQFDCHVKGMESVTDFVVQSVATALVEAVVRAQVPVLDEAALRALPAWLRDAVTEEIALPEQDRTWSLDVEELVKLRVLLG